MSRRRVTSTGKRGSSGANGKVLFVRMTIGEHQGVFAAARDENIEMAEWVRRLIRNAVGSPSAVQADRLDDYRIPMVPCKTAVAPGPRSTDPDVEAI
jgi:hypothetical protein